MSIDDTGERRRMTDRVSTDAALELVCNLAYEEALRRGDDAHTARVESAINKLRELKLEATGQYSIIDPDNLPAMLRRQAD